MEILLGRVFYDWSIRELLQHDKAHRSNNGVKSAWHENTIIHFLILHESHFMYAQLSYIHLLAFSHKISLQAQIRNIRKVIFLFLQKIYLAELLPKIIIYILSSYLVHQSNVILMGSFHGVMNILTTIIITKSISKYSVRARSRNIINTQNINYNINL